MGRCHQLYCSAPTGATRKLNLGDARDMPISTIHPPRSSTRVDNSEARHHRHQSGPSFRYLSSSCRAMRTSSQVGRFQFGLRSNAAG